MGLALALALPRFRLALGGGSSTSLPSSIKSSMSSSPLLSPGAASLSVRDSEMNRVVDLDFFDPEDVRGVGFFGCFFFFFFNELPPL